MRAKPDMKPWVDFRQKQIELRRSGTFGARIGIYPLGCAAGLNKYTITNNPGLAPWAVQECRPYRAH